VSPQDPLIQPLTLEHAHALAANADHTCLLELISLTASAGEIAAAHQAQWEWLSQNPADFGMPEAGEQVA